MGVGAEDGRHTTVEMPAHRHLLARHLGVEIDDYGIGLALEALQDRVDLGERRARHLQPDGPAQVDHCDGPAPDLDHRVAIPRVAVWVVGRPDHAVGAIQVLVDLAVLVDVVAGRDHVRAGGEQLVGGSLGDAQPTG